MNFRKNISIPNHVAIIMDGNGRWANNNHMLNRLKGHEKGVAVVKDIVKYCCKLGIPALTLYTFSTENWKRPDYEVSGLMHILLKFLKSEQEFLYQNDINLCAIGQLDRLPLSVKKILYSVMDSTKSNNRIRLTLALSYGGRFDITDVVLRIASEVKSNIIDLESINLDLVSSYLSTGMCGLPDPDILIRTGGEMRVSNFLLWELAYTEFFFTETLWPDFEIKEFSQIIKDFTKRNRRFGSIIV